MILPMLLFACLPETPAIWKDAFAGCKAAYSLVSRRALESGHLRFLRSILTLGLARWLDPVDLSQLMNSATMMWTYLAGAISVAGNPANWTDRLNNIFSPKNAIELSLFFSLVRLTKCMLHLRTEQSYLGLQNRHPGLSAGLLFIVVTAVISIRSGSAISRLS